LDQRPSRPSALGEATQWEKSRMSPPDLSRMEERGLIRKEVCDARYRRSP
jgi:hypothetical protein